MQRGFSLVELSIVLVILGLLTGGILAGQSLIRAAELRAVSTEAGRWITSTHTFRDKYFAIPGDMINATAFWGDDNAACPDPAITNGTPGTCNGNGNGIMNGGAGATTTAEMFQFWKQLALAGLIEGTYSGLTGPGGTADIVLGENVPRSKLSQAAWGINYVGNLSVNASYFEGSYGNVLAFGTTNPSEDDAMNNPIIKAEEAWNIDTKMDDGFPHTGTMVTPKNALRPNCIVAANNAYAVGDPTRAGCNLMLKSGF